MAREKKEEEKKKRSDIYRPQYTNTIPIYNTVSNEQALHSPFWILTKNPPTEGVFMAKHYFPPSEYYYLVLRLLINSGHKQSCIK